VRFEVAGDVVRDGSLWCATSRVEFADLRALVHRPQAHRLVGDRRATSLTLRDSTIDEVWAGAPDCRSLCGPRRR